MQIANVKGETRKPTGRNGNERLRRKGLIPAVIYGHGETPETVALSQHDLEIALENLSHVINFQSTGAEKHYLIKEVQFDHLQKLPLHVDLMRVDANERVKVKVRLELRGTPAGAAEGGMLMQVLADLDIECLLLAIPDSIRCNVAHLGMNQVLHVREVELPAGVTALNSADDIVAVVRLPRGLEAETPVVAEGAEATVEPEVIGRVAKEKPGEGEQ